MPDQPEPADSDLAPLASVPATGSTEALQHAHGPGELHSALLALLLPRGSHRAAAGWMNEVDATPQATRLRAEAGALPAAARLPWFELLLVRMAGQPLSARQALLESARRIMAARGAVAPIDTLHYLAMRRRFGERAPAAGPAEGAAGYSRLPESDVHAIARYAAFLTRMVPVGSVDGAGGAAWYASVMKRWQGRVDVPPQTPLPDTDGVVHALHQIATLPMMQRPVLLRDWVSAALTHGAPGGGLTDLSADALRLSATLLDTPLPPELARQYIELYV